jgi:uncharacterized phiE125 gp8 family phage protein
MTKVTSAPALEPVTLQEVKLHCRIDSLEDDDLVNSLISAARQLIETQAGIRLVTQTIQDDRDEWPDVWYLEGPVQSVSSVDYLDSDGNWQEVDLTDVDIDTAANPARVAPGVDLDWPEVYGGMGCVSITYVAGYGAPSAVPAILKQAIKLLVAHWYAVRETVNVGNIVNEVPYTVDAIVKMFQRGIIQ